MGIVIKLLGDAVMTGLQEVDMRAGFVLQVCRSVVTLQGSSHQLLKPNITVREHMPVKPIIRLFIMTRRHAVHVRL